jgi:hypothetical protein
MDLKKVPHLIFGETEEEKDKDRAYLAGLRQFQREKELDRHDQHFRAQEEFSNVPKYLAERKKRLDNLALEKRKREEAEEKKSPKGNDFVTRVLLLFLVYNLLKPFITSYNIFFRLISHRSPQRTKSNPP